MEIKKKREWNSTLHRLNRLVGFKLLYTNNKLFSIMSIYIIGFPDCLVEKSPPANAGATWSSIRGSGRSPSVGNGNPLQYSCQDNPMDREDWQATVHGVKELDMIERLITITIKSLMITVTIFIIYI